MDSDTTLDFCSGGGALFGDGAHRLDCAVLTSEEAKRVRDFGAKLVAQGGALSIAAHSCGVDRIAVSLTPNPLMPDSNLAVMYMRGDKAGTERGLSALLATLPGLTAEELQVVETLKTSFAWEQIFGWQDDLVARAEPGMHIPFLSAMVISDENAEKMRELVREMRETHIGGLAARARAIGYFREAMALAPFGERGSLYLLYLELKDPEMGGRLQAYPDTAFTRWWNPRYVALLPPGALGVQAECVWDWRSEDFAEAPQHQNSRA